MKKSRINLKRRQRKHSKKIKEKAKFFSKSLITLYDHFGNAITMTFEEFESFLDMEVTS